MELRPRREGKVCNIAKHSEAAEFPWHKLPLLVQDAILGELAGDYDGGPAQGGKARAAYAAVCSDWQAFFEKISFRKLVLHEADLGDFERIVKRRVKSRKVVGDRTRGKEDDKLLASTTSRMPRIQHIWLRVELLNYDWLECTLPQGMREIARNNAIFTKALWKLLDILSTWENTDADHGQQLILELSAHSPGDSRHFLQGDAEHGDDYPYRGGIGVQRDYIENHPSVMRRRALREYFSSHDIPDWNYLAMLYASYFTHTFHNLNGASTRRLISCIGLDPSSIQSRRGQPRDRLPEVKMVSSFIIRRQYHRSLNVFALRRLVRESLTGLRDMRCERWRTPDLISRDRGDWHLGLAMSPSFGAGNIPSIGQGSILGSTSSQPLETLSLFEDFSKMMHGATETSQPRPSETKVLQWVASSAINIKNLSVSFLSDAKDSLRFQARSFPNLESLALTSQHWLEPTQLNTGKLLYLAAKAALKMPSLQIMEIWTCGNGHAAIFRYEATGTAHSSAARLTWRCSWDVEENPIPWESVIAAWNHVAATNAMRELRFTEDPLTHGSRRYEEYGAILHQLKLRNLILDPISVMQVRMGTGAEDEPEVEGGDRLCQIHIGHRDESFQSIEGKSITSTSDAQIK